MSVPARPGPGEPGLTTAASELDVLVRDSAGPAAPSVLRCRTVAQGHFRQLTYVRDLPPYAIEQRLGPAGDGTAPTPAEALLAALGSCIAVGVHANAIARAIPLKSLHLDLEADFDPTAVWGVVSVSPGQIGFNSVRIVAHIEADAPRAVLEALLSHVVLWSPVSNTIHNPVHIEAVVA